MRTRKSRVESNVTLSTASEASRTLETAQIRDAGLESELREKIRAMRGLVTAAPTPPWPLDSDVPMLGDEIPAEHQQADISTLQIEIRDLEQRIKVQKNRVFDLGREQAREVAAAARPEWKEGLQRLADELVKIGQHCDQIHAWRASLLDECLELAAADPLLANALPLPAVSDLMLSKSNNRLAGWLDQLERQGGCNVPAQRGLNGNGGVRA